MTVTIKSIDHMTTLDVICYVKDVKVGKSNNLLKIIKGNEKIYFNLNAIGGFSIEEIE